MVYDEGDFIDSVDEVVENSVVEEVQRIVDTFEPAPLPGIRFQFW